MKKIGTAAGLLLCLGLSACNTTDPYETKVFEKPTQAVVVTEPVPTESSQEEETEPETVTEAEEMDLTVPFKTTEATTAEETIENTEEPTPQTTRDPIAWSKRKEMGIYDLDAVYEDAYMNYRIHFVIPQVYTRNAKLFDKINKQLVALAHSHFDTVYVLRDLNIEYIYETMMETDDIMSYLYHGYVKHLDTNEGQFIEQDHTLHGLTVGRCTGEAYNIEDVYGMERLKEDIKNGEYKVVAGMSKVFRIFSDEQLSIMYEEYPSVPKDPEHYQDFYVENGKVVVIIWVGNAYNNYVLLELNGKPLPEELQVEETTMEDSSEELSAETEETAEPTEEEASLEATEEASLETTEEPSLDMTEERS